MFLVLLILTIIVMGNSLGVYINTFRNGMIHLYELGILKFKSDNYLANAQTSNGLYYYTINNIEIQLRFFGSCICQAVFLYFSGSHFYYSLIAKEVIMLTIRFI